MSRRFIALTLFFTSLSVGAWADDVEKFLHGDLASYQGRLDRASKEYQEEQWLVETADPKASSERMPQKFSELQRVTYDKAILEKARAAAAKVSQEHPARKSVTRSLKIIESTVLTDPRTIKLEKENQDRQDKLVFQSNAFRLQLPGEKEAVSKSIYGKRLGSLKDRSARQRLWQGFNSARATKWGEWGFRELIHARNEEARIAGFSNYYEYRFSRNQLNLSNYRELVEKIKSSLAPKIRRVLQQMGKRSGIRSIAAWDLRYLREQSSSGEINEWLKGVPESAALEVARDFYQGLGIDIETYGFTKDLFPRAGKNTHAFAMAIVFPHVDASLKVLSEPKMDIRFLANLRKPVKWSDISTMIHELGHAIHAAEVRQPLAFFRGIGSVETEAFAMLLERMASSAEFLERVLPKYVKVSTPKLKAALKKMAKATAIEQAIVLLRQAYFSDFEYHLYREPASDFAALWSKLHKEWWGVEVLAHEADWDVEHYLMAPVYVQNYALGIVMVEQYYDYLVTKFKTGYGTKPVGDALKRELFAPGLQRDYLEMTESFTGKPLAADAALKLVP